MITAGSYMYIKGTNIEVGVRRVSQDPLNPFAACTFRYGRNRWKRSRSKCNPIRIVVQKIPFICLTHLCDFDRRQQLKKSYKPSSPTKSLLNKKCFEGKYEKKAKDPNLYDIWYEHGAYFHLLKGMTESSLNLDNPSNVYTIFGIRELTFPFKHFDYDTKVVTFNTTPVRKAHMSVLRNFCSMPHLMGHAQKWNWSHSSLRNDPAPVELGYICGSSIPVSAFIQDNITLFKMSGVKPLCQWIPNTEVTTRMPYFDSTMHEDLQPIKQFKDGVYLNGLPFKYFAFAPFDHPIHTDALLWQKEKQTDAEYTREEQERLPYIYLQAAGNIWKAYLKNICKAPADAYAYLEYYRQDDKMRYVQDYRQRSNELQKYRAVAVN